MDYKVLPIHRPNNKTTIDGGLVVLIAQVTSEEVGFSIAKVEKEEFVYSHKMVYKNRDYSSFLDVCKVYLNEFQLPKPDHISISVASPVLLDQSISDKLAWPIIAENIKSDFDVNKVSLINDVEAVAYGLFNTSKEDLLNIYQGNSQIKGNVAVLSPGKGLGEAGLFWDGEFLRPFATEGGHSEFSPRSDWEVQFYQFLKKIYNIVSWENVLSEEGLLNIYRFLRDVKQHEEPKWLTDKLETQDAYKVIVEVALKKECRICTVALDYFVEFMARESNNLVLKLKATGGLVITGEIPNMIYDLLNKEKFYKDFIISDKMEFVLKDIPIYLLRDQDLALSGAAFYSAYY